MYDTDPDLVAALDPERRTANPAYDRNQDSYGNRIVNAAVITTARIAHVDFDSGAPYVGCVTPGQYWPRFAGRMKTSCLCRGAWKVVTCFGPAPTGLLCTAHASAWKDRDDLLAWEAAR